MIADKIQELYGVLRVELREHGLYKVGLCMGVWGRTVLASLSVGFGDFLRMEQDRRIEAETELAKARDVLACLWTVKGEESGE